jgi:type IX secretion system PorP/SprF family membrane protein
MYNTMSVNPGYAGQRDALSITALYRTQWVGIDGAPETQTLGVHAPFANERMGWGVSIVNDAIGPSNETYFDGNYSYTISLNNGDEKFSFGIKAGFHILNTDWSKGRFKDSDDAFKENLNLFSPIIGAGLYVHSYKWYLGVSVPNMLTTKHFDEISSSVAADRLHYFFIGGYVFDLNENLKFKPAYLVKLVSGAPLIADISGNFLINEKVTLGLAYRWDDSISALTGFQISDKIYVGYSFDYTTTALNDYNSGTHEIMLRFELFNNRRFLSPRFF